MKKFFVLVLIILIITIILSVIAGFKPLMSRTCNLGDFGISLKIPYMYTESSKVGKNTLLNLYNRQNGISISSIDLGNEFWSSNVLEERVEEYLNVISATNYDARIQNSKSEIITLSNVLIGRTELEIVKPDKTMKMISLIMDEKNGNVAIEIYWEKEYMDEMEEDIENIISTINFGENKHIYSAENNKNTPKDFGNNISSDNDNKLNKNMSGEDYSGDK